MALTVSLDDIVASGNSLLAVKPNWNRVRLGDVGEVLNGYAFKAELFTREGGMPLIRIRDVGSSASETFYSGDFDERYVVSAGDLLVGMDGDFNCARWRGPRSLLNQRVCKITVDEALYLPRFLDYVLPGYLKAINDATSSITVKHLSSRTIQDIPLPLPPMDEQREIVAELEKQFSRLDEAVANLQRVKANLKRYKASVLKAAVEGRLVETEATLARREGRTYETGEQLLQRILEGRRATWVGKGKYKEPSPLDSNIGTAPEGWSWAAVELVCESIVDCPHSTAKFQPNGYPCVDTTWMTTEGLVVDRARYVDEATYLDRISRLAPKPGDIVFAREGTIGTAVLIPDRMTPCLGQRVMLLRTSKEYLNGLMAHVLHSEVVKSQYRAQALGSTVAHINVGDVKRFAIPVPPLAEQVRILAEVDRHLSIIREVEAEVDANLQRANALRQATLQRAFAKS